MKWFDDLSEDQKTVLITAVVQYGGIILLFLIAGLLYFLTK